MSSQAFSADVELTLRLEGRELELSHVGPDFFYLQGEHEGIDPQEGTLVVRVDEHVDSTRIRLLSPIEGAARRVGYERVATVKLPSEASR